MITTAFLIKVIIYGLVAAIIIPAIDFVMFLIRESRRTSYHSGNTTTEWKSETARDSPIVTRKAPAARQTRRQAIHEEAEPNRGPVPLAAVKQDPVNRVPAYVASNGVTITPSMDPWRDGFSAPVRRKGPQVATSSHPHAEYWCYGDARFYEHV